MTQVILQITEPRQEKVDGLYHSWLRHVNENGNILGVQLEFTCPRYEGCPSTVNDAITRLQWMLFQGLLGADGSVMGVLLGFIEGEFDDIPDWFTGGPKWTEFPHSPATQHWNPDRPDSGKIVVPIP